MKLTRHDFDGYMDTINDEGNSIFFRLGAALATVRRFAEHIEASGDFAEDTYFNPVTPQTVADSNARQSDFYRSTNGWDPRGEIPTEDELRDEGLPEFDASTRPDNQGRY